MVWRIRCAEWKMRMTEMWAGVMEGENVTNTTTQRKTKRRRAGRCKCHCPTELRSQSVPPRVPMYLRYRCYLQPVSFMKIVLFLTLLVTFNSLSVAQKAEKPCPANTFSCKDGSCIPLDWIGDGEPDCSDGSDEDPKLKPKPKVFDANSTSRPVTAKSSAPQEDTVDDPFDQISTKPPSGPTVVQPDPSGTQKNLHLCANDVQLRISQCSENFVLWAGKIGEVDFINNSALFDKNSLNELSRGCDLLSEFRTCTEGLETKECDVNEHLKSWSNVELYLCQLLLPSIKEHEHCFGLAGDARCANLQFEPSSGPVCNLVSSVRSYIDCIKPLSEGACDERAVEVLEPIKTETVNVYTDIKCQNKEENAKISLGNDCPECANVMQVVGNPESSCKGSNIIDMWSAVRRVVCGKKDELIPHAECFIKLAGTSNCNQQPLNASVCAALTQFNTNLECSKPEIQKSCTSDAENALNSVRDAISDDIISQECFLLQAENKPSPDGFSINPLYQRCNSEQENAALTCLVQLTELNKHFSELQSLNFLEEISDGNSSLIGYICDLYDNYNKCLNGTVFARSNGERCSFNSPLNTLARVGLSPICSGNSRELLYKNRECMKQIRAHTAKCQLGLGGLGNAVNMMLQGIHGEALLCKSFYSIRGAFDCAEELVSEHCSQEAGADVLQLREEMTILGIEEGCPAEAPENLDEIISMQPTPTIPPVPSAHAIPKVVCEVEEQQKFQACVQPMTNFQPHPLAVIKQPKLIDEACAQYQLFKKCQAGVNCHPLWAIGMSAMFDYACGQGYNTYIQIRQCVRKFTTREDIRDCVSVFSRGEPQHACQSSNTLLACAQPLITEKCGPAGGQFVRDYIEKFATAIDPACRIGQKFTGVEIKTYNCSVEEDVLVQHCAAPLNELSLRLDDLFAGGLQAFLANVKNLAPLFAQGCNLTTEFRQCARPVLHGNSQCIVSSCMIQAGDGICNQPDTATAIDENLNCVFKQASDPEFAKCVRSTISTLKVFNLEALRGVLPQFVNCVENIVVSRCGQTPLNVLRAISSTEFCKVMPEGPFGAHCTSEMEARQSGCAKKFYNKYRMIPVALVGGDFEVDTLCADLEVITACTIEVCEDVKERAFRTMVAAACRQKETFKHHFACLTSVSSSESGLQCFVPYFSNATIPHCTAMTRAIDCVAPRVLEQCGTNALQFAIEAMNAFSGQIAPCMIRIKPVTSSTNECSENDLIEYLQCEAATDSYSFTPIAYLKNVSQWNDFCAATLQYETCVANMSCKIEPLTTGTITFYKSFCGEQGKLLQVPPFANCLSHYIASLEGQKCLQTFGAVDLFTKEGPAALCSSVESALACAAPAIHQQCGILALQHVYNTHFTWTQAFNKTCNLTKPYSLEVINKLPNKDLTETAEHKGTEVTEPLQENTPTNAVTTKSRTDAEQKQETMIKTTEASEEPSTTTTTRQFSTMESKEEPQPVPQPKPEPESTPEPIPESQPEPVSEPQPEPSPEKHSTEKPDTLTKAENADIQQHNVPEPEPTPQPKPQPEITTVRASTEDRAKDSAITNPSVLLLTVTLLSLSLLRV